LVPGLLNFEFHTSCEFIDFGYFTKNTWISNLDLYLKQISFTF